MQEEVNKHQIPIPKLNNNPSWDVIVTQTTPLLSFFNAPAGPVKRHYQLQLDTSQNFNSRNFLDFPKVKQNGEFVSDQKITAKNPLQDKVRYYWRVRTVTDWGVSSWAVSRFYVDTEADKQFMNLVRIPVANISVSKGFNSKNIIDWDDPGLLSFWQSPPPGDKFSWIQFDLEKETEISRAWILSNPDNQNCWLKDFVIQKSLDSKNWQEIKGGEITDNDTFRNIIDFKPVKARFLRVLIKDFIGYTAQVNEIIFYSPGKPKLPQAPKAPYVLIIGNEHNGYTFTDLEGHVKKLGFNTLTIPCYEISLEMLEKLDPQPAAIILSGNNADYPNLPMFEYNGEFEIIRKSRIPILGICAGHQFLAMAYGYTRARSMGWSDITAIKPLRKRTQVKILVKDPIFTGIKDNFVAPEIHGWAVVEPGLEFKTIAASTYIQAQKSSQRLIYGEQFHAEINASYNHGQEFIKNFLKLVML